MYTISHPSGTVYKDGQPIEQSDDSPECQEYVEWLRQGNGPTVIQDIEPAYPRIEVSAWQIRKALNKEGLREAVEAWVAASDSQELKDGYNHAPAFWSDHQFALAAGAALGKDVAWMYNFFITAKSL